MSWSPPRLAFQQPRIPVIGFISGGSADASARFVAAFRKGLGETGSAEGQNVTVEYHWLEGQYDRLPALLADLVAAMDPRREDRRSHHAARPRHLARRGRHRQPVDRPAPGQPRPLVRP
jgi:hypothetical protein